MATICLRNILDDDDGEENEKNGVKGWCGGWNGWLQVSENVGLPAARLDMALELSLHTRGPRLCQGYSLLRPQTCSIDEENHLVESRRNCFQGAGLLFGVPPALFTSWQSPPSFSTTPKPSTTSAPSVLQNIVSGVETPPPSTLLAAVANVMPRIYDVKKRHMSRHSPCPPVPKERRTRSQS
ncbi:hypothetical protein MIND_01117800 [Mycena indigotica]|uniref:Uncharacterized protein n=1 Tax=Mycena indigotica TaxID=2126181 RepID=A0A8H6S6X6_9AGAR|nr:uncharacterized protein MIND_01117800 [Mycena indigotica]KAF7293408.1 hypothetical protein MIND_01117800 [Mycena indigotica]